MSAGGRVASAIGMLTALILGGAGVGVGAEPTPVPAQKQSPNPPQPSVYDAHNRRDPFVPLVREGRVLGGSSETTMGDCSQPTLGGILWDPSGHSIALINDSEFKVGDLLSECDYRVAEIRKDAVVLSREDESIVLRIAFEDEAKPKKQTSTGGKRP